MACRLCHEEKLLRNSHVISEFLYKPLYEPNLHRSFFLSTEPKERRKFEQKGLREKLLCSSCEQKLSAYENYVRKVIYGGVEIDIRENSDSITITNLDYKKFKLFQLSILWHSGVSKLPFFSSVKLGTKHEEILRQMIFSEEPGEPHEYGCLYFTLLNDSNQIQDDLIMQLTLVKIEGRHCYRFVFGGMLWLYIISSHIPNPAYKNMFLTKDGTLVLFKKRLEDFTFIRGWARELKLKGKF